MITRKQFIKFCDNHKIKYDENSVNISCRYFVKYKDAKDPSLDKSLVYPSDTFIYVSFTDKDYDESDYLYKPFEKLYVSTKPDEYGWYGYTSYGDIHILEPIHCYGEDELKGLFSTKNFSKKDTFESTVPFNTLDQLEHLYSKFNQFAKDVKDFYYSESFQNTIKIYKDNLQTIKNLRKGTMDLVNKSYNITKKKAEIEDEFAL